ncbi:amino acid adenylation domain-containing protein [Paenibacillus kyungheensis]|uniref:Amino acid adenylation domain-containing protein n=1 Tax=Paenibacillus kyungheensis TaxID=1452732 RepID=A0AAX3M722_9BACL|nr:amino acid adenylation domain-containing protein [Paenibacillus kyungheensis]WCT58037.1 amino acid adenylation domain-containing protein [Paenibacillus kyungheensis]
MSKKIEIQNVYSLSSMQEGMLFHSLVHKESGEYVLQAEFDIHGSINVETFRKSLRILANRYDILRSIFNYKKASRPLQIVLKERSISVQVEDLCHLEEVEKTQQLQVFKRADLIRSFDLTKDMLIRTAIIRTEEDRCKLMLTYHHILMDGWCLGILFNELTQIYDSLKNNTDLHLPYVYPYWMYIKWVEEQNKEQAERYWEQLLAGYEQSALLPQAEVRHDHVQYQFQKYTFSFDLSTTRELTMLAQHSQVTLYTVMQTLWGVLLQRYNNTTDVVFGAVVSGRPADLVGSERMVGLFINTVPVRIRREDKESFAELVTKVQLQMTEGSPYEYFPLHSIQANTMLKQNLFQHIIVYENYPIQRELSSSNTTIDELGFAVNNFEMREQTNYDLNIIFVPGELMTVTMTYNAEVYSKAGVQAIESHLSQLVRSVLDNPSAELSDLEVITVAERKAQLPFHHLAVYPEQVTLSELFEQQVQRTPDTIAVVYEGESITYRDLNARANQLAYVLHSKGAKPDKFVALLFSRSIDMIVAILATLKAGSAYVPIDPAYPEQRIRYMLEDSQAVLLLVDPEHRQAASCFEGTIIQMNDPEITSAADSDRRQEATAQNLAYVIYTSGTTGMPKGVMIEHRNVVSLFFHEGCLFDFGADDVWTMFHSYCFDFSVWEMYGALLHGSKLVIVPDQIVRDPQGFLELLQQEQVTILNQTPTMFYHIIQADEKLSNFDLRLRIVIFGGEALAPYQLKGWKRRHPQIRLINMYGITETTVHVTFNEITDADIERNLSNIGSPLPTLRLYILDEGLNLLPQGAPGEIYVGGEGVARGYLNRLEWTNERFISNPYAPGDILYKTGDLGKWHHNWQMEYLGRADQQIKVRGYRIEVDEIEFCLLQHDAIQEVVVLSKKGAGGTVVLCSYIKANRTLQLEEIRGYIGDKLPSYMVPSFFYQVNTIPLTTNGKVDRQALLALEHAMGTSIEQKTAATDEVERELFAMWKQVLGVEHFGIHDHFFDVGGNSILLIQVHNLIDNRYPGKMTIADLFTYSTISKQKELIYQTSRSESSSVNIQGLVLPSSYYAENDERREATHYRFSLSDVLYNQLMSISRQEQVTIVELMQGLFVYVLSELLETQNISLQILMEKGILQIGIDFQSVSDFSELFRKISDQKQPQSELYNYSHLNQSRQQALPETVYPVFAQSTKDDRLLNLTDYFDFGLEWRTGDKGAEFIFHMDHRRLDKEKMRSIYSKYVAFLKVFAENQKAVVRKS